MISQSDTQREEAVRKTSGLEPARDNSPVVSNPDSEMHKQETGDPDETDSLHEDDLPRVDPVAALKTRKRVKNSDNDPLFSYPLFEAYIVNEVNGADAEEVPQFVLTRHELVQIVKYWYGRTLDDDFFRFRFGGTASNEIRIQRFAPRRIRRAAAAIGQETVDQAIEEVREEFKAKVDPRLWNIFEDGSDEEWREVREEFCRKEWEDYCASYLREMEQLETKYPNDMVALVFRDPWADKDRPVLFFPTADSELVPLLEASREFEVETDESRIRALIVDRELTRCGFIRARRQGGDWLFDFPGSASGTLGWDFLESVVEKIKKLVSAGRGENPIAPDPVKTGTLVLVRRRSAAESRAEA